MIILLIYVLTKSKDKQLSEKIIFGLILGGAFSNLFDRFVYRGVIDYLDFRIWPVFNISDACITTGVMLYFLWIMFLKHKYNRDDEE